MCDKCNEYKKELTKLYRILHRKNLELDALAHVWCDGGCDSGLFRWCQEEEITEEQVYILERNALRLRNWFEAKRCRTAQKNKIPMEKCKKCSSGCFTNDIY